MRNPVFWVLSSLSLPLLIVDIWLQTFQTFLVNYVNTVNGGINLLKRTGQNLMVEV